MRKIVLFDFCMNFGGASQGSLFLLSRLQEQKFDVFVIDAYGEDKKYQAKADEYSLKFKVLMPKAKHTFIGHTGYRRLFRTLIQIPSFIQLFHLLYTELRLIKPDVIIINNSKSLFLVSFLKKIMGFKVLLYYRGEATPEQIDTVFIEKINKYCDALITHSNRAYENLKNILPNFKDKVYFTQNCIDIKELEYISKNNDFPSSESFTLILASGRPVKEKGHDIAIKAVAYLNNKGLKVNLIIPGSIPVGHSNKYYLYLKELVKDLSLENQVKFIGWRNNFIGDLVQSDAILLPSHSEGFPRAIIEAMLLGIPICATPVGGIPEAIIHNRTGLLFDIDDVEQLSNCIYALATDINFGKKLSSNAKEFSSNYFNPMNNTKAVVDLIIKITTENDNM